jgi:hypothetical protein
LGAALDRVRENNGYLVLAAVTAAGLTGLAALLPRMRQEPSPAPDPSPPPI